MVHVVAGLDARLFLWATGALIAAMLGDELLRDWLLRRKRDLK